MKFFKPILLLAILFVSISNSYSQKSKVVFFRTFKAYASGVSPKIYLNDTSIVKMKTSTFKVIEIQSKTVEFTTHLSAFSRPFSRNIIRFEIDLKPDSIYYIKFYLSGLSYKPKFELISRKEMKELSNKNFFIRNLKKNNLIIE